MFSSHFFSTSSSSDSALVARSPLSSATTPRRAVGFSCVDAVMFAQILQWVQPVDVLNLTLVSREFAYRVREALRHISIAYLDHVHSFDEFFDVRYFSVDAFLHSSDLIPFDGVHGLQTASIQNYLNF